eukprot:1889334-Pleurochrysis_carterae.AAC.1
MRCAYLRRRQRPRLSAAAAAVPCRPASPAAVLTGPQSFVRSRTDAGRRCRPRSSELPAARS